jgi:hypothetical protein
VKWKLLLDSIDAWPLTHSSLINKRKKALLPVVLQRQQLADGFARYMAQLGLERRHKVKTIGEILSRGDEREPRRTVNRVNAVAEHEQGNGQGSHEIV